jgi:prepilin signal peptidase PulO-like enzyme (type II secretory pathway)
MAAKRFELTDIRLLSERHSSLEDSVAMLSGLALSYAVCAPALATLVAAWWLFTVAIVRSDLNAFLIPDWASGGVALLALSRFLLVPGTLEHPDLLAGLIAEAVFRAICAFAALWLIGRLYELIAGRQGLGVGDVKLCGVLALWLEADQALIALELATFAALIFVFAKKGMRQRSGDAIPFGAFLAPAAWIIYVMTPFIGQLFSWPL